VPSWAPRSSHRRPFSGPARSANQSVSASCGKDASSQAAAAVCIPRVANTAHAGQRNPPSTAYTCASAQDRHETQGWREKLLSSTAAAAVALAVAGMSVAAYPPPSIAAAAAAAEVGGFTEGPLDALQRQLRETDRALTRSLRKAQAAVADGIQAIAPPTRNVNGIMEVVQEQDRKAAQDAAELVWEVWDVVDREYMDARHTGFNHDAWAATRDAALKGALDSPAAAHKAVRLMMDRGLQDPYSRFISPQEFDTMKQYDMTGVGLNLGTAEEFHRKVGKPFPPGREDAKDGVWVIGIIQGSEAEREGLRQGDEVVALDGQPVSSLSPYQVSLAVAGEAEAGAAPPPHVQVRVRDSQGTLQQHSLTRTASVTQATVSTSVAKRPGGGRTGRIRISTFRNRTQVEVSKALQQCEKEGVTHLELDLRGNLGGLVSQGVETARLFLDSASHVPTSQKSHSLRRPLFHTTKRLCKTRKCVQNTLQCIVVTILHDLGNTTFTIAVFPWAPAGACQCGWGMGVALPLQFT